jgi:hypothetical protein
MPDSKRRSVSQLSGRDFADLMAEATYLGVKDASSPPVAVKTTDEVIATLGLCDLRKAHSKFLKSAYMAGRFQIDTMGMD